MAVNIPLASQDPYLLNLDSQSTAVDPNTAFDSTTQLTDNQNTLGPATAVPGDVSVSTQAVPLSGDTYTPPSPSGGDTGLPFLPPAATGQAQGPLPTWDNTKSWQDQPKPVNVMPTAQAPIAPPAPPAPTFGNDFAGSVYSLEQKLPNDWRAGLHGAQSGVGPLAGMITGMETGALIGTFADPVTFGLGTLVGGVVGGLVGAWLGQQAQDQLGGNRDLVSQQTMDALKAQTDWDQQNESNQYAIGQLVPQALAFRPSPSAIAGAFKLAGRVATTAGMAEKLAVLRSGDPAAINQLQMMAMGPGLTVAQNYQAISEGKVQPNVLAIQLIGSVLLSQPTKWLRAIAPSMRGPVQEQLKTQQENYIEGRSEGLLARAGDNPEAQEKAQAIMVEFNKQNALLQAGKVHEAQAMEPGIQQMLAELNPKPEEAPVPVEGIPAPPETPVVPAEAPKPTEQIPGVDRPLDPVEAKTKADLAMIREENREFPPEPTRETTPGGISNRIREAVTQSPAADAAFQALSPYGEVHVVGGAVRNMIAGKSVKDLDMTFSGTEDQLSEALSKIGDAEIQKTGDRFPVYRLNVGGDQVEIALHRTENPENQNSFATGANIPIHEDLGRRDFTTNAMAVNIKTGNFVDPHNGLKHTQSKSLSLVNPKAFAGDPVRMLRALRFIGDGYHANKTLLASMKENASLLTDIPPERIQAELDRIFSSENPGKALEAMKESGVLDHIFPEHLKTVGFDQRSTHHNQLLWDHIIGVVKKVSELNPDPDVRMAAFLHDISKPDTQVERPGTGGKMSYLGHEDKGAVMSKRILTGLKYSNDRIAKIEFLVKNHMFQQAHVVSHPAAFIHDMSKDLMGVPVEERQAIVDQRIQDLFDIREADQANHPVNKADIKGMREALDSIGQKPIGRPASNIDGNDLIDLGLKPGPEFSRILKALDHDVLYGGLPNEHESLLQRAKEIAAEPAGSPLQARRLTPHEEDPWVATRRAVLDYGGIGPSKDWPKDMIPGDLYRQDGKAPDMVATEATIGRADIPPWGDGKSDSDMMRFLQSAWEQHVKFQQQKGAYAPAEAVPMTDTTHVNHIGQSRGRGVRESNLEVRSVAMRYTDSVGLPPPTETPPVVLNREKAARLAKFYEKAQSDPTNPEVQASYHAFNAETQRQWEVATRAGYTFEPWEGQGQPYRNSAEMRADILNNKHLFYFRTEEGQPPHELMTPDQNDKFRAVHDFFGHAMNGNEFGPTGEENAWAEHSKMYSPLAQKAMTTETRAQNSTVNFGTHGEHNRANPDKTIYADQKALIPPREFLPGQQMQLTHWSAKPRKEISSDHQGESGLSSELSRTGPNENKDARFASYYEEGQPHERFFGPGTPYPVKHTITGDYKILDLNSPEAARLRAETTGKNQYGVAVAHEFDNAAKAAGYDGYKNRGTVRLFGKQPVSHINDLPVGPQDGQTEFTARIGQGQTLQAKKGELNGLQQETTGQPETSGQAGIGSETGLGAEASNAGQVGDENLNALGTEETNNASDLGAINEPTQGSAPNDIINSGEGQYGSPESGTVQPSDIGAGDVRADAGDEARAAGATIHAPDGRDATGRPIVSLNIDGKPHIETDFSPQARATRDRTASERGTTLTEYSAKDGSSGWTASSDVEEKFIQDVHDIATKLGVDMSKAPQFMGRVRLSQDEHGELLLFQQKPNDRSNKGNYPLHKVALFVPDDPRLIPHPGNAKDWPTLVVSNKLVDQIRLHQNGNPDLEYLPAKITDDATRVALILKGWDKRFFYDRARAFPDSAAISFEGFKPGAKAQWAASQPVFGDGASVIINGRNVITHFSRMQNGVFKNHETGEEFDPKIFYDLVDAGIIKQYGHHGISVANIMAATKGFLAKTLKIGDYAGAMENEARAPVDLWRARLAFGKENTATTKMYDYEFGRNNFLTRMFSPFDHKGMNGETSTPIMPHHIQSAEWFGYQQHVSESLARIKQAAMATGDAKIIEQANGLRADLESKDLVEIFRDHFGLNNFAKPPMMPFDKILGNPKYRESLLAIAQDYTRRYLKGAIGGRTRKGGFKDLLDIQEGRDGALSTTTQMLLRAHPELRQALANYYKKYFIEAKTIGSGKPGAAQQSLDRNIGEIAERIAREAYAFHYPNDMAALGKSTLEQLLKVTDIQAGDFGVVARDAWSKYHRSGSGQAFVDDLAAPLNDLHDQFGLPRGLIGLNIMWARPEEGFANFAPDTPNQININAPFFNYFTFIRNQLAPSLEEALKHPDFKDLKGAALAKVKKVIGAYATGDETSSARVLLGHELAHAIQYRIYGRRAIDFEDDAPDHVVLPAAVSLLENMTPKYMVGLVREGLGNELEAMLQAHSSSINEYLGGIKGAEVQGEVMPLAQAVINILEHQAHQWVQFQKITHADYSWATPEVFRRNVYEPEIAEANYKELGKIWQKAIKALDDPLAVEASTQRGGRGPNPRIDSEVPGVDETSAGIAAYAKLPPGSALQSGTSGWTDPRTADQEVAQRLTSGERASSIGASADALRQKLQQDTALGKPQDGREQATLKVLENEVTNLGKAPEPARQWPVADPRLATSEDPWLQKATAQSVARIQRSEGEGDRAFALRLVKASGAYNNLDHAVAVVNAARDGAWAPVLFGDKVGFKVEGKFYRGTPGDHVANWAAAFHDAIHDVVDNLPDRALIGEPAAVGLGAIHPEDLSAAFADEFKPIAPNARVGAATITNKMGEAQPVPSIAPHHFLWAKNADRPSSELPPGAAANKVAAHFDHVQESLDMGESLADQGLFDPEVTIAEEQRLADAGEGDLPPMPPDGGGGDDGEPPIGDGGRKPKGDSPEERRTKLEQQRVRNSADVLSGYLSAAKDSLNIEDPGHLRVATGLNDLTTQIFKSFSVSEWYKDSRAWVVDAANAMRALAKAYQNVGTDITDRISALEAKSPGANDRIRNVQHADGPDERDALLKGMSNEEAALANHIHHYWKITGDVLMRAGISRTAIENYFPLMVEKLGGKVDPITMRGYSQKTDHAIARLKNEDGSFRHTKPEDLQAFADDLGLDWKVRTGVGDVFMRQGMGVTRALTTKHAIDQLAKNSEVKIGKKGEFAPPILTNARFRKNAIVTDPANRSKYVKAATIKGPWRNALTYTNWVGDRPVVEDYWVHKSLAEVMERDTGSSLAKDFSNDMPEPGRSLADRYRAAWNEDNPVDRVTKSIGITNQLWKTWQFFLTPMHEFSLLGNLSTHAGFNPFGVARFLTQGKAIVNDPAMRARFYELIRAGAPNDPPELTGFQAKIPFYKAYHDAIWKSTMYNGTFGLADKLAERELLARAARGDEITAQTRAEADKIGMEAAKKAMGSMNNLDLSKNWSMWGNVIFLANRWTTGQLRSVEESLGQVNGPFGRVTGNIPLQGHDAASTKWMQDRTLAMSRQLLVGGMIRLAIVGSVASTAISAALNNGVASTPFDNFQKDPGRTFDIYAGRDPVTQKDNWYRMPFYLFQREMVDWVLSAVKANNEGAHFIDPQHLEKSTLAAPFLKFTGKLDPVTKLTLETATGTELSAWMKGYSTSQIDQDPYIANLNKSLQMQGFADFGSLENRFLNAIRSISPASNFPTNLQAPTNNWGQIMGALGIGVGPLEIPDPSKGAGSMIAPFFGSSQMPGIKYSPGPDGTIQPAWKISQYYDNQTQVGQQILHIAATLGTGTLAEEKQKLQQMEDLRQRAGLTPGQLTSLILHGDSSPSGDEKGLLATLPSKTSQGIAPTPVQLGGVPLTAEQQKAYYSVTFQRQSQAILQAVSDPRWKTMNRTEGAAEIATLKAFADRITNQQFEVALGIKHANIVSPTQADTMLAEFGMIKNQTQAGLLQSSMYAAANPQDQATMLADRVAASQNAVWEKYYGITSTMKGASASTLSSYVALQGGLRDETRMLMEKLPSYTRSLDPAAQAQQLKMALTFADNLVNQSIQGKTPKTFDSPLTQSQLISAVRNGVVLQDAALKELHGSFIYQEAPQTDQLLLDSKYVTLAHNIALYDTRHGIQEGSFGDNTNFNSTLATTLAADEGYQTLVETFFGRGGRLVLQQREAELSDLKARFKQEYNVAPADLSRYDALINRWYKQMNPDYAGFLLYRTQWEKYDRLGQAYRATIQSNYGFEQSNPLALAP